MGKVEASQWLENFHHPPAGYREYSFMIDDALVLNARATARPSVLMSAARRPPHLAGSSLDSGY
ncbi:hypothetical protein [Mycobacterium palustre]|uniref:hypothetical protein n=1 Tax=Mycobacterium palustre TaxID=153971 RepID=UPI001152D229|nr:hypothetical protein [Mycobacterium palustre]MCV7102715.1 hypothetical protein [Mycobacterium palustre]